MALIVLDLPHNSNGVTYSANSVIDVDATTVTWLTGIAVARAIVAGPAAWAAGSYAANNLVTNSGGYYVNNASAVSGDVPGVAAKWVAVSYLASATVGGTATAILSNGRLLVKNPDDGSFYALSAATVDGNPTVALDPTPVS